MPAQWKQPPEMQIEPKSKYQATIETERGTIELELYAEDRKSVV